MNPEFPTDHYTLLQTKLFHFNNIRLELYHYHTMSVWYINIHIINRNEDLSLFGIHLTLQDAQTKFNSIQL